MTSTLSFEARRLHAEKWRITIMMIALVVILAITILRRVLDCVVMSLDAAFYPSVALLCAGLLLQMIGFAEASLRARRGRALPRWHLFVGAAVDLGVPFGVLWILHEHSPRGAYAALSGPTLLVIPIVVMLSVLSLRPVFSMSIGLVAAGAHWALAIDTLHDGDVESSALPVILSYGVLLVLTGAAAGVLGFFVRRYIREAVVEAEVAERANRSLASFAHELEIARTIQQGLLPSKPPSLAGFDIAGMARPATQAGGDYYDWQPLLDGRLVVAIADVTGHGIGPALVMAVCRAYSRATAPLAASAQDYLERVNGLIVKDALGGRFITMAIAIVSPDGTIDLLSAGHGPTFLYRAETGKVEYFGGNGLPLGVSDEERYDPTVRLHMSQGDVLVLLTDGYMERASARGGIFGIQRLVQIIGDHASQPAAGLIAALDHAVSEFAAGEPQGDDMTAVVLRRL